MRLMVTGGCGFIGSAVVRLAIERGHDVLNVDALTYSGTAGSVATVEASPRYHFAQLDIRDTRSMREAMERFAPSGIIHLAAETHVDRSIDEPATFVTTNVDGTVSLLEAASSFWRGLDETGRQRFRFHHVSTDEVFGSLGGDGLFTADTPYAPRSPYSASKAAADHFVRAWRETYGLPTIVSNCSNNYGPFQFPEKLIPLMILRGVRGSSLPVYGDGTNVRDWLHVEDHADALLTIFERGKPGDTYLVGGESERSNIEVVTSIADILDEVRPPSGQPRRQSIEFVKDRPGHDFRYAIDASHLASSLGWRPSRSFDEGLESTVRWYLENEWWWGPLLDSEDGPGRLGLLGEGDH